MATDEEKKQFREAMSDTDVDTMSSSGGVESRVIPSKPADDEEDYGRMLSDVGVDRVSSEEHIDMISTEDQVRRQGGSDIPMDVVDSPSRSRSSSFTREQWTPTEYANRRGGGAEENYRGALSSVGVGHISTKSKADLAAENAPVYSFEAGKSSRPNYARDYMGTQRERARGWATDRVENTQKWAGKRTEDIRNIPSRAVTTAYGVRNAAAKTVKTNVVERKRPGFYKGMSKFAASIGGTKPHRTGGFAEGTSKPYDTYAAIQRQKQSLGGQRHNPTALNTGQGRSPGPADMASMMMARMRGKPASSNTGQGRSPNPADMASMMMARMRGKPAASSNMIQKKPSRKEVPRMRFF